MKKGLLKVALLALTTSLFVAGCGQNNNSSTSEPASVPSTSEVTPSTEPSSTEPAEDHGSINGIAITSPGAKSDINVGETLQLKASVTGMDGKDGAYSKEVTWAVAKVASGEKDADGKDVMVASDIASVSETGLVTALKVGSATITATSVQDPTKVGKFKLTVTNNFTVAITNKSDLQGTWHPDGSTREINISIKDYKGDDVNVQEILADPDNEDLKTTSSNPEIIKVNNPREIEAVAVGTATITVQYFNFKDTVEIEITEKIVNADTRHAEYVDACLYSKASKLTEEVTLHIQGQIVQIQQYADSANINVAIQEGKYGYFVNNVPGKVGEHTLVVGDSISMTAKNYYGNKAKMYGGANYSKDIALLSEPIAINDALVLGNTEASFEESRNAKMTISGTGVVTEYQANDGLIKFTLNDKTYRASFAASGQVSSEALVTKLASVSEGTRITKLQGVWGGAVKEENCPDVISLASADDIEIEAALPASVAITGATEVQATQTIALTAAVSPSGAPQDVVWSSSDETKATVNAEGVVTGVAEGPVKIIATAKGTEVKAEYDVTVKAAPTAAVSSVAVVAPESVTGAGLNETVQLTATVLPNNAPQTVTWSSSDESVATVDEAGLVTFVGDGPVTITASSTDGVAEHKGTVSLNTIVAAKTIAEIIAIGSALGTQATSADTYYVRGTIVSIKTDGEFIVADEDGAVEAYNLKAPEGFVPAVGEKVLINAKVQRYYSLIEMSNGTIVPSKATVTAPSNDETEITTKAVYEALAEDGTTGKLTGKYVKITNCKYEQSGSYSNIANINGEAVGTTCYNEKGVKAPANGIWGTAYGYLLTTNSSSKKATIWLHEFVPNDSADPAAVTISGENTVMVGEEITLSAFVSAEGFKNAASQEVVWSSSDDAKATVDKNGKVKAIAEGSVTITATAKGTEIKKEHVVTVEPKVAKTKLDLTTKAVSHSAYNDTWTYGDFTISGGANNSGGWAFVKFGGKSATISAEGYPGTYVKSDKAISYAIANVTIDLVGVCYNSDTRKASAHIEVYSDAALTTKIGESATKEIPAVESNASKSLTFTPSEGTSWAANSYYKVVFDITNTTTSNGVIAVEGITFTAPEE